MTTNNGWRTYYNIADSRYSKYGNMKCNKCDKIIKGAYLVEEKQNFLHRGNETDEMYLYHKKCSSDNEKWIEYNKEQRASKKALRERAKAKKEILEQIKKYGFEAEELFDLSYIKSHIW